MKRKLLKQMSHEWRSNVWLIIEIAIVSVVLWPIFMYFTNIIYTFSYDYGYETTDMYMADIKVVPQTSESYQPYDSAHSIHTDLMLLEQRIRHMPCVEFVGRGANAMPYNYNYASYLIEFSEADSIYRYMGNHRSMSPDIVRALKLRGNKGETPEQLAAMLERGLILISDFDLPFIEDVSSPELFVGHDVIVNRDSTNTARVGAVVHGIHRSDYEILYGGVVIEPFSPGDWPMNLIIKVKPDMGKRFTELMDSKAMEQGNVYLSNLQSLANMRDTAHVDDHSQIRTMLVCGIFLMTMIFLGFLGTFWFRTQQRAEEIAVRRVNGATTSQIFRRLIGEGMLMLTVGSLIALPLQWALVKYAGMTTVLIDGSVLSPWWGILQCYVVLAAMVFLGILSPARKAMKTSAAEVLK